MVVRSRVFPLVVAAFAILVATTGCGRRAPVNAPNIDNKKFIGTWIENRTGDFGPNFTFSEEAYYRAFELKDDKTFKFYYVDKDGKPVDAGQEVTGTWEINGVIVEFKVDKNTLAADRSADTPARITDVATPDQNSFVKTDIIYAGSVDGMRFYRRLPSK